MKYANKSQAFILAGSILVGGLTYALHFRGHKSSVHPPAQVQGEAAYERLKQDHMYDSLQTAVSAARYRFYPDEKTQNAFYANNSAQHLTAYFTPDAATLTVKHGANSNGLASEVTDRATPQTPGQGEQSQLSLKFIGAGYGDAIHRSQGQPAIIAAENRVTYTHRLISNHNPTSSWHSIFVKSASSNPQSEIEEWFINKPEGVEHGFTVNGPVGGRAEGGRLRIALELSGDLQAKALGDGQAIALNRADGEMVLSYDHLKAFDAAGRELPADMRAEADRIFIAVDDTGADYPITIDPLFAGPPKLTAPDGAATDQLGFAVAADGGTIVVGAPFDDAAATDQGSAYVFVRTGDGVSFQAKLTAGDASANDNFGYSVAINADTVVVGALHDDSSPFTDSGSAYVFVRNGSSWSQQAKLTASDGASNDEFGCSVAIANVNDVIVGARLDDIGANSDQGSAYLFIRSSTTWTQQQKLVEQSGGFTNDQFGYAVALGQNRVVVGSPFDNSPAPNQGSAYIFVRSGVTWTLLQKLTSNTGQASDSFGIAVALDSNTIVVGAHLDDFNGTPDQGSAYVFSSSGGLQQELIAGDGLTGDAFGISVAVAGATIVIGASFDDVGANANQGSAYVFSRPATVWTLTQKLTNQDGAANDFLGTSVSISRTGETIALGAHLDDVGANADQGSLTVFFFRSSPIAMWAQHQKLTASEGVTNGRFGCSLALSGDTAVVGADATGFDTGAAYVFVRSGATWVQQQKLTASDGEPNDRFGGSVSIDGDTVVVGAHLDNVNGNSFQGSAYIFVRSGVSWTQQQKLTASDGIASDIFGLSVTIGGDTVVIGSADDVGSNFGQGSAYVFGRSGTTWTQQQKLTASDGEGGDAFSFAVAISGDTMVVGAPGDEIVMGVLEVGSAYIFVRSGTTWTEQQKLIASDGTPFDEFGISAAISGDTVVVGAYGDQQGENDNQGSSYVFVRLTATTWTQQQKLSVSDGAEWDRFGFSVSISGDTLVVGAYQGLGNVGKAHIFVRSGLTWTHRQTLTGTTAQSSHEFGFSVAISGLTIMVGERNDDVSHTDQGSVFVFVGSPNEITVANTNDSGTASLRQAIVNANANPGLDIIKFSTGTGLQTVNLSTALPTITDAVIIDGTTQPGYSGTPLIELTGIGIPAPNTDGLIVNAGFCTIRGLAINRFSGNGIRLGSSANNTLIAANHIGVDASGTIARPNGANGILGLSFNNQIGGTTAAERNIISSNVSNGVELGSSNRVLGNYIGTSINGTSSLGNSQHGIFIPDSSGNRIGGTAAGEGNTIAFNGGDGVFVQEGVSNTIRGNSIHSNAGLGIDLGLANGVTPNDAGDGDFDGGNLVQNFPVITLAQQGSTIIQGALNSTVNTSFTLDFYSNPTADPTNHGEGRTYIGSAVVTTDPGGTASFNLTFPPTTPVGHSLSGTATDPSGNTSEFGQVQQVTLPTAVEFAGATATQFDRGTLVEWHTGFEVSNLGFNLYRDENGTRTLVNPQLIAGSALTAGSDTLMTAGRSYSWFDASIADCGSRIADCKNIAYWLEDVDTSGQSTWHGPVYVARSSGPIGEHRVRQATLLSALGKQQPTQSPSTSVESVASLPRTTIASESLQTSIGAAQAVKLLITHEGWYRVTRDELLAAGFASNGDPRNLQLVVDGVEQPILVVGKDSGSFDSFEAIEFYGLGTNSPYSNVRTYWLAAGNAPGRRVPVINTKPDPQIAPSFPFSVERKDRAIYFASLLNSDAENWFGSVVTSNALDQPITIRSLDEAAQDKAELEIALQGVTSLAANPDHQVEVRVNNQFVGYLFFDGRDHKVERFAVPIATLNERENLVTLRAADASDVSLVDRIRLTYPHRYTADDNSLKLTTAAHSTSQAISGFTTGDIRVFDVTDPAGVRELTGVIEPSSKTSFSIAVDALMPNRTLLSLTTDQFKKPASIAMDHPSSLRQANTGADFLIIARHQWMDALEPLKTLREKQGFATLLVDLEDIFDEFSFGQQTPFAIRDFLSYASIKWKRKPRWVLFAGDASFDPRNYTGLGDTDFVPTRLTDTAFMETASDDWLADFNADGLPELAIGRLPIRSPQDAISIVNKLLKYEVASPSDKMVLFADLNDGFDFESASSRLRGLLPSSLRVQEIFRSRNNDAATKADLLEALNRGSKIVNSVGHGSVSNWRGNQLTTDDAHTLTNSTQLPLFVMMNCLNGYFQDPLNESLAESLMRNENGGAIAVWASSGMTFPNEQALINQQLYRTLFGKPSLTLGEHVKFAKLATADPDVRRSWILFGDPTTRIR